MRSGRIEEQYGFWTGKCRATMGGSYRCKRRRKVKGVGVPFRLKRRRANRAFQAQTATKLGVVFTGCATLPGSSDHLRLGCREVQLFGLAHFRAPTGRCHSSNLIGLTHVRAHLYHGQQRGVQANRRICNKLALFFRQSKHIRDQPLPRHVGSSIDTSLVALCPYPECRCHGTPSASPEAEGQTNSAALKSKTFPAPSIPRYIQTQSREAP